ncbi:MAG: DUF349 domain-containing protein [Rikenellaceae bacterium]
MTAENLIPSVPEEQVGTADTTHAQQSESATTLEQSKEVDFADEEAQMAADAPEYDLGEVSEAESTNSLVEYDLNGKNEGELIDLFVSLLASKPVQALRADAEAIKIAFYKLHRAKIEVLKREFLEGGGLVEEFKPNVDNNETRLKEAFAEYRTKRGEFLSTLEQSKEENLKVKLAIIEELKELINSSETINHTFNHFRELQQKWKDTGLVPQANNKDIWETYNLHVENFYNFIKINKELRDLDLKRNLEAKTELCEGAEALLMEDSIVTAFHKLQKLHDQWREIGPVAKEYKETLWERFKQASSRINKNHQDHFDALKNEQIKNLELKTELCVKTEELLTRALSSRKDWNKASEKLIDIQKVWKTIGFAPKKDNTKIYERFRAACDKFFEIKRTFYLGLKAEMEHNLELKEDICIAAETLIQSQDWKKTTDELIALQKKWKQIGPVSRRHSDAIWKRFREACDKFFANKSAHFSSVDSQYEQNLKKKEELLASMETVSMQDGNFEQIKDFQRKWNEIGFVPIKQKDAIAKRYKAVVDRLFSELRGNEHSRQIERFKDKVQSLKGGSGEKKLRFERERLYNKVKQMEADIALLENNIGFFSKSKNAESMISDVKAKIEKTRRDMQAIIEKINLIDNQ